MEAKVTAKKAITICKEVSCDRVKAPTNAIPHMAFAPDIKGVCKVLGTLDINSSPKYIDNNKTKPNRI